MNENLESNEEIKERFVEALLEIKEDIERSIRKVENVEIDDDYFLARLYYTLKYIPTDLQCGLNMVESMLNCEERFNS